VGITGALVGNKRIFVHSEISIGGPEPPPNSRAIHTPTYTAAIEKAQERLGRASGEARRAYGSAANANPHQVLHSSEDA
jgi:hypothetical protein